MPTDPWDAKFERQFGMSQEMKNFYGMSGPNRKKSKREPQVQAWTSRAFWGCLRSNSSTLSTEEARAELWKSVPEKVE